MPRVDSYPTPSRRTCELRGALDKGMAAWEFDPPVEGYGLAARPVLITLAARTLSENAFQVRMDNVSFPSSKVDAPRTVIRNKRPQPKFPRYTVSGVVTVDVSIDAEGLVLEAAATQCSLHDANATRQRMKEACDQMEANGIQAVRKWKFAHEGRWDQPSYPITGTIPLYYIWGKGTDKKLDYTGQWLKESRTAYRRPAWRPLGPNAPRVGASDVRDSALVHGDPALRLKEGFIGRVL